LEIVGGEKKKEQKMCSEVNVSVMEGVEKRDDFFMAI